MNFFIDLLKVIKKAEIELFVPTSLCLDLTFPDSDVRNGCMTMLGNINLEKRKDTILRIYFEQENLNIFYDIDDFKKRINKIHIENENFKFNIFILDKKDSILYKRDQSETFINFVKVESNYTFSNTIIFFKLLNFLKQQEHKEDQHFYFVDHYNTDHRKIIVTSLKKEGKLTIGYPKNIPEFDSSISIQPRINRFISSFEEKQLPKFIKAELFNFLPAVSQEKRLETFIHRLDYIMEKAEQNFEIYLSDLSLDNFKNQFLEFRLKYFNEFRDMLSKITTQILAFPLSITASSFAIYKVIDSILLCSIIVVAFIAFSIYSLFMLKAHKDDIKEIKRLFETDYKTFSSNTFFQKYPLELKSFKETYDYILMRSIFLENCIEVYSWVLIITNSLFIIFVLTQVSIIKTSYIIEIIKLIFRFIFSI